MRKVSDVLKELVSRNSFLAFGLSKRLFNLTQLAEYLRPYVEAASKKEVKNTALVMALSRLGSELSRRTKRSEEIVVESLTAESSLFICTFEKSVRTIKAVQSFSEKVFRDSGFLTLTEGRTEVTLILDKRYRKDLSETIKKTPLHTHTNVASLSIRFDPTYLRRPGFLYTILQKLTFQGVNILEVASTSTEFIVYLHEKDLEMAFSILQPCLTPSRFHAP